MKNPVNAASNRSPGSHANTSACTYSTFAAPDRPRLSSIMLADESTATSRRARGASRRVQMPEPHASSNTVPPTSNASTAASTSAVSRNQPSLKACPMS